MATHADADLLLKLYDLRREAVCRQARAWFAGWMPGSAAEAKSVCSDPGRQDNAWLRQAVTYWEMAFSIANTGAIDPTLFGKNCGEGLIFMLKCRRLKERFPEAWTRSMPEAEAFLAGSPIAQQKADAIRARMGW